MVGVLAGIYLLMQAGSGHATSAGETLALIVLASLPVVLLGLIEDVTKKIPPRVRMAGALVAGALAIALLEVRVHRTDLVWFDAWLGYAPLSVALTLLMVCGFTNAMNIVDGLNGLAGGATLLMLGATGLVAARYGDQAIVEMCIVLAVAVGGFLLVNFPRGLIFLGDGGAYFVGFVLTQIWLLLISRNPDVTPWFVIAIAFHPTMETIFSIVRRRLLRRRPGRATDADRLHLHSLVYRRRATRWLGRGASPWLANAIASLMVLLFSTLPISVSALFPSSAAWNATVIAVAACAFVYWFLRMVRFRAGHRFPAPAVADSDLAAPERDKELGLTA